MKKFKKIIPWLPTAATVLCAIITCILYVVWGTERGSLGFIMLFGTMLLPAVVPVFNLIFKRKLPFALGVIIAIHLVLGNFIGSVLSGYNHIPWYDLAMHGAFGFVGAVVAYTLLMRWNGDKLSKFGLMVCVFAFVMACAALWEVYEYLSDGVIGGNAQAHMDPATGIEYVGRAALADTMEDIMITLVGLAVFYITAFIDKLGGKNIIKKLLADPQRLEVKEEVEKQEDSTPEMSESA